VVEEDAGGDGAHQVPGIPEPVPGDAAHRNRHDDHQDWDGERIEPGNAVPECKAERNRPEKEQVPCGEEYSHAQGSVDAVMGSGSRARRSKKRFDV
jgi:hypothetical protein